MDEGFETFDHTGDLGLEIWAETPERLYALAAEAVSAQRGSVGSDPPEATVRLELTGQDPEDLLVHWLNSSLLEADLEHAVWNRVRIHALTPRSLDATLDGPRLDPKRHVVGREVKAVSQHELVLTLEPPRCRCRLVLDI
jgi:SHS2 domain-containing protein